MPTSLSGDVIADLVKRMLAEDLGKEGDISSKTAVPQEAELQASFNARKDLVLAGWPVSEAVIRELAPDAYIEPKAKDGDALSEGDAIALVRGPARALLSAERSALNILQHLSGIATLTADYVDAIKGTKAQVLDTRKTIPGLRVVEKYAVAMGGGTNHRMGLFDAVMLKDNHIAAAGGVAAAVAAAKAAQPQVQVECDTLEQVQEALDAGATSLLLDNMSTDDLRMAVQLAGGKIPLEASGGVKLSTIRAIAETGVDYISVGRLTQSAPAVDIGLDYMG